MIENLAIFWSPLDGVNRKSETSAHEIGFYLQLEISAHGFDT